MAAMNDLDIALGKHLEASLQRCPQCNVMTVTADFLRERVLYLLEPAALESALQAYRSGRAQYPVFTEGAIMREGDTGLCVICIHRGHIMSAPGYEVQNLS